MNNKYSEYCMKFTNRDIKKFLYDPFIENVNVQLQCLSTDGCEIDITSNEKVETISYDEKENVSIMFFGYQTSIFVYNVEIMFIDEDSKGTYTSSDVYNNVVYEGGLRGLSHEEMLKMLSDIILCFIGAEDVSMTQFDIPKNMYKKYNYYEPHKFLIKVKNSHTIERTSIYENITIKH